MLQLLLKLERSVVVLEDALVEVASRVVIAALVLVVHYHIVLVSTYYLHVCVCLRLHHHASWKVLVNTVVVLLANDELRVVRLSLYHLALSSSVELLDLFLLEFLLTLFGRPVYSVSHWLAAVTEDGERIQPRVGTEDLNQVLRLAHVVWRCEGPTLFVEVFNGGLVFTGQHEMELQKCSHQSSHSQVNQVSHNNHHLLA